MERDAFARCIKYGLGRPILWLKNHPWQPYEDAIVQVCLHDTAYDNQCEDRRADYVFDVIKATGAVSHFGDIVVKGLMASKDPWDTNHLFGLARLLAQNGYAAAKDAMYAKFKLDDAEVRFAGVYSS